MKKTILFCAILLAAIWMINQSGNNARSEGLLMDNVDALASGEYDGEGDSEGGSGKECYKYFTDIKSARKHRLCVTFDSGPSAQSIGNIESSNSNIQCRTYVKCRPIESSISTCDGPASGD